MIRWMKGMKKGEGKTALTSGGSIWLLSRMLTSSPSQCIYVGKVDARKGEKKMGRGAPGEGTPKSGAVEWCGVLLSSPSTPTKERLRAERWSGAGYCFRSPGTPTKWTRAEQGRWGGELQARTPGFATRRGADCAEAWRHQASGPAGQQASQQAHKQASQPASYFSQPASQLF